MPLDMRPTKGKNEWYSCDVARCINRSHRMVYFMGHFLGRVCSRHAKEWNTVWDNSGQPVDG